MTTDSKKADRAASGRQTQILTKTNKKRETRQTKGQIKRQTDTQTHTDRQ